MSKNLILYHKDELSFSLKLYTLMDLLISNQVESRIECFIFMGIFYLQYLSAFFAKQIGVFDTKNSVSDKILNYIEQIVRIRDLFINKYHGYQAILISFLIIYALCILHFFLTCRKITELSYYSYNKMLINYYIKFYIFIGFNIVCDLSWSSVCFGSDKYNPMFEGVSCSIKDHIGVLVVALVLLISVLVGYVFMQVFYSDSFYLSNSFYAKMNCGYDLYWAANGVINSALLIQCKFLSKEIFLIYNIVISLLLLGFYIQHYLYYDKFTNMVAGIFHSLYAWTSIFSLIFAYIDFKEKGIAYILTCIIIAIFYVNYKNKLEAKILLDTPFYKIKNKSYLLFYFKTLIDKINSVEESPEDKAFLSGIIKLHAVECPLNECLSKNKNHIFLPMLEKWTDRSKEQIDDDVFLKNFIIIVMNYFLYSHSCNADMYLNLSLYYLRIIGNYCQAIYFYKKAADLPLTLQEKFTFQRLHLQISKAMVELLKDSNDTNVALEFLNVSLYYKYDSLSQKFVDEISSDVNLSLEFWKMFRASLKDQNQKIDFNKVFELTDKIRVTKRNVEKMWNQLLKIYGGPNGYFELYIEYIDQINDDELKKRELEGLKRKSESYTEHLNSNFYSILFNKETGIIIANGDKGSEGIIELANLQIENIFKYKPSDLKGMNLTHLMPKIFARDHSNYMERYFKIGEKKLLDKTDFKTFGKDKNNSIVKIKLALKLFPILNESVYFAGMIVRENIDDIILLDHSFIIQGMSLKLMKLLNIDNKYLFSENEIPFYVICRKFVNFYNIFLKGKKKEEVLGLDKSQKLEMEEKIKKDKLKNNHDNAFNIDQKNKKSDEKTLENVEINENVELEYEIKLPQFLIDYSEKTNKKDAKLGMKLISVDTESEEDKASLIDDDFNEDDILINEEKEADKSSVAKDNSYNINNSPVAKDNASQSKEAQANGNNKFLLKPGQTFGGTPSGITPNPVGITPEGNATPGEPGQSPDNEGYIENLNINNENNNLSNSNSRLVKIQAAKKAKLDLNKQSEEEKEYRRKVRMYKKLFETEDFNGLEDLIDSCNKDSTSNEYKFNFTFDRYKFGNNQIAFIVRCIDNKNDGGKSDEESVGEMDATAIKFKKDKADSIKPIYEILEDEKQEIIALQDSFFKLSLENKKFQKLLQSCKSEITMLSKTHGQKKDQVYEDENASQSSQASFDSGLVKKNRIEEVRSTLLKNVSNFYTLKYIRIAIFLLGLCTFIFCVLYLVVFWGIYDTLIDVSSVNVGLFQTTLWSTELVSVFLSMRTLLNYTACQKLKSKNNELELKYCPDDFGFRSFLNGTIYEYYDEMSTTAKKVYQNISSQMGILEMDFAKYLPEEKLEELFWDRINITYVNSTDNYKNSRYYQIDGSNAYGNVNPDNESFPMSLAQILNNANSFVSNSNTNLTNIDDYVNNNFYIKSYIEYLNFIIIENGYDNLLPNQYVKLETIPTILSDYNKDSKVSIILIIVIYAIIMILCCVAYYFLIRLTNKSMTDGLEKMTKIRLEKIDETIKKINSFNTNLKRFRDIDAKQDEEAAEGDKEGSASDRSEADDKAKGKGAKLAGAKAQGSLASIVGSNGFNTDVKKYIPLNVLNTSFIHCVIVIVLLCGFLIPILIISNQMITSTNTLLLIQNYIFGKLISSSASTVEIKCFMSQCQNQTVMNYSALVNMDLIQDVIKGISVFSGVSEFYNEKFLVDACAAAIDIDEEPESYQECMDDTLIVSANNTDNLIKLIENLVDNLYKEYSMGVEDYTTYNHHKLFNTTYFSDMEYIFYYYIIPVGDKFAELCATDLDSYLGDRRNLVLMLAIILGIIMVVYCIAFGVIFVRSLVHYLNVSRCVMKIIPTSVIISTQELETWIENKY